MHHARNLAATSRDKLRDRVVADLSASNFPRLRHLTVEERRGVIILRGQVNCYYERQMALRCASQVHGVDSVVDQLTVAAS